MEKLQSTILDIFYNIHFPGFIVHNSSEHKQNVLLLLLFMNNIFYYWSIQVFSTKYSGYLIILKIHHKNVMQM